MRNVDCNHYSVCLAEAAREGRDLNCQGCPLEFDRSYEMSRADRINLLKLRLAVVDPEAYRTFLGDGEDGP